MKSLSRVADALAPVIDALHSETLPAKLVQLLMDLSGANDASLLRYRKGQLPDVEYSLPPPGGRPSTLNTYITGPFLLDPFYRGAAIDHRFGVFHLRDLAPAGFTDSEYYRSWYKHCGFVDECGLLIELNDGFLNIALGLHKTGDKSPKFYKSELTLLENLFPVINSLCKTHWNTNNKAKKPTQSLRESLHDSLSAFGSSVLTRRERQVTELVLLGNSTRLIAEKLGISTETVKLHRKHAYAKLDVSSQAELFLLFMEALANSPSSAGVDPLIAYHSKPSRS